MKSSKIRVTFVLPTFNEKKNVKVIIDSINSLSHDFDCEIIVVDDNSPDGTGDVVKGLTYTYANLRIISRYGRRGLASAIKDGILSATGQFVVIMDVDGQHDTEIAIEMINRLLHSNSLDLVVGSRFSEGSQILGLGTKRSLGSKLANTFSRLSLNYKYRHLHDYMSGFFTLRYSSVSPYCKLIDIDGFKFLYELLSVSKGKLLIEEVPFRFMNRLDGSSKLDLAIVWDFIVSLIHSFFFRVLPRRMIAFGLVGCTGVLVQLLTSEALASLTMGSFAHTTTIAVCLAATWNYAVNNQITFASSRLKGLDFTVGLFKFMAVSSLPIAANIGIATYFHQSLFASPVLAQFAGIAVSYLWNYMASSKVVWNMPQ